MKSQIKLLSDPALRARCVDVAEIDPIKLQPMLDEMFATMTAEGGMGLAANQIGYNDRIFILKRNDTYEEFINPIVVSASDKVQFEGEACLSIPGVFATTERFKEIRLRWSNRYGEVKEETMRDLQAFAVQHEIDHLDGKLFIDQFGPVRQKLLIDRHKKHLRNLNKQSRINPQTGKR